MPAPLQFDEISDTFKKIYEKSVWGGSGAGSRPHVTVGYREFLISLFSKLQIRTVVDIGCGDWQFSQLIDWRDIDYTGIDVDESLLRKNTEEYGKPNIRFAKIDVFSEPPAADLLICKDVMQHWPNDMIRKFFPYLNRYKYALLTNCADPLTNQNTDIELGSFRPLDLLADPFHLPGAKVFEFRGQTFRKVSILWSRDFSTLADITRAGFSQRRLKDS